MPVHSVNGSGRRTSIATSTPTDAIGPTTTKNEPINAFDSNGLVMYSSQTLPTRRYSTTTSPVRVHIEISVICIY